MFPDLIVDPAVPPKEPDFGSRTGKARRHLRAPKALPIARGTSKFSSKVGVSTQIQFATPSER
jgi:hypothetical protein